MDKLTTSEMRRLQGYEATIKQGLLGWMDVSRALIAIHQEQLYRQKADTFEDYCAQEFEMSARRAYQLIEGFKASDDLRTIVHIPPPQNEAVAREVAKVETEQERADLWVKANATSPNRPPTASHVARTRKEMFPPNGKLKTSGKDRVRALMTKLDGIEDQIVEQRKSYRDESRSWQTALEHLESARQALQRLTK